MTQRSAEHLRKNFSRKLLFVITYNASCGKAITCRNSFKTRLKHRVMIPIQRHEHVCHWIDVSSGRFSTNCLYKKNTLMKL